MIKNKITIIDPATEADYYITNDIAVINLCACFPNLDSKMTLFSVFSSIKNIEKINVCNYSSFCYNNHLKYNEPKAIRFLANIIQLAKSSKHTIVQNNIENCMEVDMKPISSLIQIDEDEIFIHKVMLDELELLGFSKHQLCSLLDTTHDFNDVIPIDRINILPIANTSNLTAYKQILGLI